MKSLMRVFCLPMIFFSCWLSAASYGRAHGPEERGESGDQKIQQIFPSSKKISIKTRPGYAYFHLEGDSPQWSTGSLQRVNRQGQGVSGNGQRQVFEATTTSGYHLVEEHPMEGSVLLKLVGEVQQGFHYFIRCGGQAVTDGEVQEHELSHLSPLKLPAGEYTIEAVSVGYGTSQPLSFSITQNDEVVTLPLELVPNRILLFSRTHPPEVGKGRIATLRKLDPIKQKELWHQEVEIDGSPLALSEGQYLLEFPAVEGFSQRGSHGVVSRFELSPYDHSKTVVGDYLKKSGELFVCLQSPESVQEHLADVAFTLTASNGTQMHFPRPGDYIDTSVPNRRSILVTDLSPESYTLDFQVDPRTFHLPPSRKVQVSGDQLTKMDQELQPNPGGVRASVEFPGRRQVRGKLPKMTVRNSLGEFIRQSSQSHLFLDDLPPGDYELAFEHVSGYEAPRSVDFVVKPGEIAGPFIGLYEEGSGSLVVSFSTGPHGERLSDVGLVLTDQKSHRYTFPGERRFSMEERMLDHQTKQVVISDLPAGVYSLGFDVPNYDHLFLDVPTQMVVINKGRTARVHQAIEARYGSVEAYVKLPTASYPGAVLPEITLRDHYGEVKATASGGELIAHHLKPGNYQVVFGEHDEFAPPPPLPIRVEPLGHVGPFYGEYTPRTGTLLVNFSTGDHADRLDKVRFWVANDQGYREMFPKEGNGVANGESKLRSVRVEDLPQGNYTIQFLLPNADGLFATVPDRRVTVSKGSVAEITQRITPRYGSIQASIEAMPDDPNRVHYPKITLRDQYDGVLSESWDGQLAVEELLPGEYVLSFESIEGYEEPEPVRVSVDPGRAAPPIVGRYQVSTGTLVLLYDTDPKPEFLDEVSVKVIDLKDGQPVNLMGAKEEHFGKGRRLTLSHLPVGRYLVGLSVPSARALFPDSTDREVLVRSGDITQLAQQLRPTYGGIEASVKVAKGERSVGRIPTVYLQDVQGAVVSESKTGHLLATELPPGKYRVVYEQLNGYLSPTPVDVRVGANQIEGPFIGQYTLNSGRVVVSYSTGGNQTHLDKVRFWISNEENFRRLYPIGNEFVDLPSGKREVVINDLPLGDYTVEFFVPELGELFSGAPDQSFTLRAGQTAEIHQGFEPQYGSITAYLDLPDTLIQGRKIPKMELRDHLDRVLVESKTGVMDLSDVIPGEYLLAYESLEDCCSPDPMKIQVKADTKVGPFIGKYSLKAGTLLVEYGTGVKQERLDRVRFWLIDANNRRTMYPVDHHFENDPMTGMRSVEIPHLPEGNYALEFLVPNVDGLFGKVPRREIRIRHGEVTRVVEEITPRYGGMDVNLTFPQHKVGGLTPQIFVKNRVGKVVAMSDTGSLSVRDLNPGRYEIAYEQVQGYDIPENIFVEVHPDEVVGPFFGTYHLAVGALIVNYDTGHRKDFLDKVRFWVVNEHNSGALYPVEENYIDDQDKLTRKVIVPDLPAGEYTVDFVLPELNGLFQGVPKQSYTVRQGEVTTLDRSFTPLFASLEASVPSQLAQLTGKTPLVSIKDNHGRVVSQSSSGELIEQELIPGTYTLEFGSLENHEAPEPIVLTLGPKDAAGPFVGEYQAHVGNLTVRYSTGQLQDQLPHIQVKLTDEQGRSEFYPSKSGAELTRDGDHFELNLQGLPVGMYDVEFLLPGGKLFEAIAPQQVSVTKDLTRFIAQQVRPLYGAVEVMAKLPEGKRIKGEIPGITLRDLESGDTVASSHKGNLQLEVVKPGKYELAFEDADWLNVPDPKKITVRPGEKVGPIVANYTLATGSATVTFNTGPKQQRLSRVKFWLIDEEGQHLSYPHGSGVDLDPETLGYAVTIQDLPAGRYEVEFFIPNMDGLFPEIPRQQLEITKNRHSSLRQDILPQYGSLEVAVDYPSKEGERLPAIQVKDGLGFVRASSTTGRLFIDELVADTYTVAFEPVKNFDSPEAIQVEVTPYSNQGPFVGNYRPGKGTLIIDYSTGAIDERLEDLRLWLTREGGEREELDLQLMATSLKGKEGRRLVLDEIPFGQYTLETFIPNEDQLFSYANELPFFLNKGQRLELEQKLIPQYGSLFAEVVWPKGMERVGGHLLLQNRFGEVVASTEEGKLEANLLKPGIYTLAFEDDDRYYTPDPMQVEVGLSEAIGPIRAEYQPAKGALMVTYDTGVSVENLDLVKVKITDEWGGVRTYPSEHGIPHFRPDGVAELYLDELPTGDYFAEFEVEGTGELFPLVPPYPFSIRKNQETRVIQTLEPQFSALEVEADFSLVELPPQSPPTVTLKESSGKIVAESETGRLAVDQLPPGNYLVTFEELPEFTPPASLAVSVAPHEHLRGLKGVYGQRYGSLEVYALWPEKIEESQKAVTLTLKNLYGEVIGASTDGKLKLDKVVPGTHQVYFGEHENFYAPQPMDVVVAPDAHTPALFGRYEPALGELSVTYSLGEAAHFIEFFHVRLTNEEGQTFVYPKEEDEIHLFDREVAHFSVNLPVGNYEAEFAIEGNQGLFDTRGKESLKITKNQRTELEKEWEPQFATLEAEVDLSQAVAVPNALPVISLQDSNGLVVATSRDGLLELEQVEPGQYTVVFEPLEGFDHPAPVVLDVTPATHYGLLSGKYYQQLGELVVRYEGGEATEMLSDASFTIWDSLGNKITQGVGKDLPLNSKGEFEVTFEDMPAGSYHIEFDVPEHQGLFARSKRFNATVENLKTCEICQHFEPNFGSLFAKADVLSQRVSGVTPQMRLRDPSGKVVRRSDGGVLAAEKLYPGLYTLEFDEIDGLKAPARRTLAVKANEVVGPLKLDWADKMGTLHVHWATSKHQDYLHDLSFTVHTEQGELVGEFPKDGQVLEDFELNGSWVEVAGLPIGQYKVAFQLPPTQGLLPDGVDEQVISIEEGKTETLVQTFNPQYGGLELALQLPQGEEELADLPKMTVRNASGQVIAETDEGYFFDLELAPGQYEISFEEMERCCAPEPLQVEVKPHEITGPVLGEYAMGKGELTVRYHTGPKKERLEEVGFWLTDSFGRSTRYPVEGQLLAQADYPGKEVVLSDLPVGEYDLQFSLPNTHGLFQDIPKQKVRITKGGQFAVEEAILPHYGGLIARASLKGGWLEGRHLATGTDGEELSSVRRTTPHIEVRNERGEIVEESSQGELVLNELVPGEYEVLFEDIPGLAKPKPLYIQVSPDQISDPIEWAYEPAVGTLITRFQTGDALDRLDGTLLTLVGEDGVSHTYPMEECIQERSEFGRTLAMASLPVGSYRLRWSLPNHDGLFEAPEEQLVEVKRDETVELNREFTPRYASLSTHVEFEQSHKAPSVQPVINLVDSEGKVLHCGFDGVLEVDHLVPGEYSLSFSSVPNYYTPQPIPLEIGAGESVGDLAVNYEIGKGDALIAYKTGSKRERIDRVRFWLIDEEGNRTMYPREDQFRDNEETLYREVVIEDLPIGVYQVEFALPNTDNLFSPVEPATVVVRKDQTVEWSESIPPHYGAVSIGRRVEAEAGDPDFLPEVWVADAYGQVVAKTTDPEQVVGELLPGRYSVIFTQISGFNTPEPQHVVVEASQTVGPIVGEYKRQYVPLTVQSNDESRKWSLFRNGVEVFSGQGTENRIMLPPGEGYYLEAPAEQGWQVAVQPEGAFRLSPKGEGKAQVRFEQQFGWLDLEGALEEDTVLTVRLIPEKGGEAITRSVSSRGGRVRLHEPGLPIGDYTVALDLPSYYQEVPAQLITVVRDEPVVIKPRFFTKRTLSVVTGEPMATYKLTSVEGEKSWRGEGSEVLFTDLTPGKYRLSFGSKSRGVVAPPARTVVIAPQSDGRVKESYSKGSALVISSNAQAFGVRVKSLDEVDVEYEESAESGTHTLHLSEGRYQIHFEPLKGKEASKLGGVVPDPIEVVLRGGKTERVHGVYESKRGALCVTSNLAGASYLVRDLSDPEGVVLGHYKGKHTVIPMTFSGEYEITFERVPGYGTPEPIRVSLATGEQKTIGGHYLSTQNFTEISGGPSILGDVFGEGADDEKPSREVDISAFEMGVYQVTNAQYATWMTQAVKEGSALYQSAAPGKGVLFDQKGRALCKTVESDSDSGILPKLVAGRWTFQPVKGKGDHPVVEVSWYGAQAYCEGQGFRLPTEAEWEKGASIQVSERDGRVKKFRYGCSSDSISRLMANYMDSYDKRKRRRAKASEVGYFNGLNLVDHVAKGSRGRRRSMEGYTTREALSPWGLYDMSGNVREWVQDWYQPDSHGRVSDQNPQGAGHGVQKVAKGGSFDSFAYEVRASARTALSPETTDRFTGFRVVRESL